ncbi:MAG: hypothetical protein MJY85_00280 [Fibrobacter sp.]|nr:hypothetical protein [Fibrobacter sp.]
MKIFRLFSLVVVVAALFLSACSSNPAKKKDAMLTSADSAVIADAVMKKMEQMTAKQAEAPLPQNLDAAHESFMHAMALELRGESSLAKMFWQRAAESDPYSRFLTFKMAEILAGQGADSLALVQAVRGQKLKGKITSSQLGLLAHLYVKAGIADSSRKYFNAALDSARYQDMPLLYDYSLFLEAVKDTKELVRIYDLLLPQVNYIPSLFQRQLGLLLEQGKDSAVIELFGRAHEVNGDKKMLTQMVQGLLFQRRFGEAKAIVDTLTESTSEDESMIVMLMTKLAEKDRPAAYAMLQKKYYEDGVRTPMLTNFLGHYENINGNIDSAKVHLQQAADQIKDQPIYVTNAYHALSSIALKENKMKDAVRYAEKADSAAMGGDKVMLAMMYGTAKMYDKAYKMLDSLIAVWDKWTPMAGIADSASLYKMTMDVEENRLKFRTVYARILAGQATEICQKNPGDSVKLNSARELRTKAQALYDHLLNVDSTDVTLRMLRAINMERLGRHDESFAQFEILLDSNRSKGVDRPEALNYYGYTLIDLNRSPEEVERGYNMVLQAIAEETDPEPSDAYLDSKAWGLYRKGQFAEALATMQLIKGSQIQEDHVYWEHLAAIQEALGMKVEATASYKKLIKMWPKNPAALRFLKGAKK